MPGVPHEMQFLMESYVLENLQSFFKTPYIFHKMIKTVGIGESYLAKEIENWEDNLPEHIRLAYLPSFGMVRLRLTGFGNDKEVIQKEVEEQKNQVLPLIDKYVYGFDDEDLAQAVGKLLVSQKKTIALAESCTGGFLAHCFTQHSGSSEYLKGSLVAYSNDIKINVLGVKPETVEEHGAVSEQTVLQMAENVRKLFKTDIGIATSGIAGPLGATKDKPVGTIWVAYSDENETVAKLYQLGNDRMVNIQVTSNLLIDWVRRKQGGRAK
jgi:nicotinamide-nucleotide amidase